jgi:hypothetical protein
MHAAQGVGDGERQAQAAADLHRRAQQQRERLAPRVREHQRGPPLVLDERERPHGPGGIELSS